MRGLHIDAKIEADDPTYEPSAGVQSEVLRVLGLRHGITGIIWKLAPFIVLEYEDEAHPPDFCPLTVLGRLAIWTKADVGYIAGFTVGMLWQRHYPFPLSRPSSNMEGYLFEQLQHVGHHLNSLRMTREKKIAIFLAQNVNAVQGCVSVSRLLWCWIVETKETPKNHFMEHVVAAAAEFIWGGPLEPIYYHEVLPNTFRLKLDPELAAENKLALRPNQSYLVYNLPDSSWPRRLRCIGTRYLIHYPQATPESEDKLVSTEEYGVFYSHCPREFIHNFTGWGLGENRTLLGVPDGLKFSAAEASNAENADNPKPERAMRFLSRDSPPPSADEIEVTDHLFYGQAFGTPWPDEAADVSPPRTPENKTTKTVYPSPTHMRLSHGYVIPATPLRVHSESPRVYRADSDEEMP
jgi:hypothetical protein